MADLKIEKALATGADYIVSTDYSCLMHLKAYADKQKLPIQVMHLADLMAKVCLNYGNFSEIENKYLTIKSVVYLCLPPLLFKHIVRCYFIY